MEERYQNSFSWSSVKDLQFYRHVVQLLAFVFLNGKAIGLSSTVLIVPYLHSTQAPFSTAVGAYDALEFTISHGIFPLFVLGLIYFTAATVGKLFCGWACPLGMVQDFLSYLPFKKQRISNSTAASLRDVKWVIVAFSILSSVLVAYRRASPTQDVPIGVFSDSPFSVLSPSGTLFAYVPWLVMWKSNVLATAGVLGWVKMAILIGVLVPSIYVPRFFCRFLCPLGALLEPMTRYKALKIYRSSKLSKDEFNKYLSDVCPTGVQIEQYEDFIESPACIHCGRCVTKHPELLSQKLF